MLASDTFVESIPACPYLPVVERSLRAEVTRRLADERGAAFYVAALSYGQSLWREGKPAQAMLQLNKAWMADVPSTDPVLDLWPAPYRALAWMLVNRQEGRFMGNPVRHFQHLATRVSGVRLEVRRWRAWACFHLAERSLGDAEAFPRDHQQAQQESIRFPCLKETEQELALRGWEGEAVLWRKVYEGCQMSGA